MLTTEQQDYPWIRHWIPMDTQMTTDSYGFPILRSNDAGSARSLINLEDIPCLILLGEPSIGKTTELKHVQINSDNLICKYNLNRWSSATELFESIERLAEFQDWINSDKRLYLYLDGLDEAFLNIKTIHNSIADWILRNKRNFHLSEEGILRKRGLYLRITCRSAIWTSEITRNLQEVYPRDDVKCYVLTPLSQEDIRVAARTEELDEDKFISAIVSTQCIGFATEPITLKVLVTKFKNGTLSQGNNKIDLYRDFCLRLCSEVNSSYKPYMKLSASQRLIFSSRLATYSFLSNRMAFWKEPEITNLQGNDLHFDDLIGDEFDWDGQKYKLQIQDISEIVNTSLFIIQDETHLAFRHKSVAEFLTAWHLHNIGITAPQFEQLFTSAYDKLKVLPQLQEVALWLFYFESYVFDLLKNHDPLMFLRSDKILSDDQRTIALKSILKLASEYEIIDHYTYRSLYSKLKFVGMGKFLKPVIQNKKKNTIVRRIAIAVAGACQIADARLEIEKVLNDIHDEYHLRKEAITALGQLNQPESTQVIQGFASENRADDPDDELKGVALNILYPAHISTKEMFTSLTPIRRRSLYGSYNGFLDRVANLIPDSDLEIALEILASSNLFIGGHGERDFEHIVETVLNRAWALLNSSSSLDLFARLIFKLKKADFNPILKDNDEKRRSIAKIILRLNDEGDDLYKIIGHHKQSRIIKNDDWDWLIEQLRSEQSPEFQVRISRALWSLLDYQNASHATKFLEIIFEYPQVMNAFKFAIEPISMDSPDVAKIRNLYERRPTVDRAKDNTQNPVSEFDTKNEVIKQIDSFSPIALDSWWRIIFYIRVNEVDQTFNSGHDFEFEIIKLPGWASLGDDLHEKLIEIAKVYLEHYIPQSDWVFVKETYRPDLAVYKALLLLQKFDPPYIESLSMTQWQRWSGIITYCSLNSYNELPLERVSILKKCAKENIDNEQFQETIRKYLMHRLTVGRELFDLYKIKEIITPPIEKMFIGILHDKKCSGKNQDYILDLLFEIKSVPADEYCLEAFNQFITGDYNPIQKERLLKASARIVLHPIGIEWGQFWKTLTANSSIAKEIFYEAIPHLGYGDSRQVRLLTADQRADILIWLYINFPPGNDPVYESAHLVTSLDSIADYRGQILSSLIEEGSVESVQALRKADKMLAAKVDFKWWIVSAKENMIKNTWEPTAPPQLRGYLNNSQKRFVRSEIELLNVVEESLGRLQKKLKGTNPTSHFLWSSHNSNKGPSNKKGIKYYHKDENSLSDFVKMHLEYDLKERSIIINREVEIKRAAGGKGERSDLYVQAFASGNESHSISLVIETKGCWHPELDVAMNSQLKERYMSKYKAIVGIYLVGWFYCSHFKPPARHNNYRAFINLFARQAKECSDKNILIKSLVLDCSL